MDKIEGLSLTDPVVALCTPDTPAALAIIRLSGNNVIETVDRFWRGRPLAAAPPRMALHGQLVREDGEVIDDLMATAFHAPASFTGQDTVELTCHGSRWITRQIINLFIRQGCRPAPGGEFSRRAFANGKILLNEAEGIADLIASSSKAAHDIALTHIDGTYSRLLNKMRGDLLSLLSLVDLELDFAEEDLEFADRKQLNATAAQILNEIRRLAGTFAVGSALRDGIPVVIAGCANAGKSTLLNKLLGREKAIVTDIPGTTRDTIDDTTEINGILFRLIDTAGLRDTTDPVEQIGISRTLGAIGRARTIIWLIDPDTPLGPQLKRLNESRKDTRQKINHIIAINKADKYAGAITEVPDALRISASTGLGLDKLTARLAEPYHSLNSTDLTITNGRHYRALMATADALERVLRGLATSHPTDLIAQDLREAADALGDITGAITPAEELSHIFSSFCIGK